MVSSYLTLQRVHGESSGWKWNGNHSDAILLWCHLCLCQWSQASTQSADLDDVSIAPFFPAFDSAMSQNTKVTLVRSWLKLSWKSVNVIWGLKNIFPKVTVHVLSSSSQPEEASCTPGGMWGDGLQTTLTVVNEIYNSFFFLSFFYIPLTSECLQPADADTTKAKAYCALIQNGQQTVSGAQESKVNWLPPANQKRVPTQGIHDTLSVVLLFQCFR